MSNPACPCGNPRTTRIPVCRDCWHTAPYLLRVQLYSKDQRTRRAALRTLLEHARRRRRSPKLDLHRAGPIAEGWL